MNRFFRAILKHPIQIVILFLLPVAISAATVRLIPRQYQSSATLWALHRYDVLSATSIDTNDLSTPAESQTTALLELVSTRSFALAVAQDAHLDTTLSAAALSSPQTRDDALFSDISSHVLVTAQGYNLFSITYTNPNPQIAQQVIAAVIQHYGSESQTIAASEGQSLLSTYQTQLAQAQSAAQNAATAEQAYIQANSTLTQTQLQADPRYQELQAQLQQAQQNVQSIQAAISTIEQDYANHGIGAANLYQVIDEPLASTLPISQLKTFALAGGIGLAIALLACVAFLLIIIRKDQAIYTLSDLQKLSPYAVVMELPQVSSRTANQIISQSGLLDIAEMNGRSKNAR